MYLTWGGRRSTIISSLHLVESGADSSACPTIPFPMSRRLNRFMASWHSAGGGIWRDLQSFLAKNGISSHRAQISHGRSNWSLTVIHMDTFRCWSLSARNSIRP